MIRFLVLFISLITVTSTVLADDKDVVKEKLVAAKAIYDSEMREFQKLVGEWLDQREEAARKAGNKKQVDQIKTERSAFEESGELSKLTPASIRQRPVLAWKALERAHVQAIKEYTKQKKDAEATAIEEEWKILELVRIGVPKQPVPAKIGTTVYDAFPAADRPKLIKDWENELEALKRAIKGDEERLARSTTAKDKAHFTRLIADYKEKLRKHEINDPPYIQKK